MITWSDVVLTSDVQHSDLTADRVGVDGTPVFALVVGLHLSYLQVPFLGRRADDAEARVVDDTPVVVGQRKWVLIKPRHLADDMTDTNKAY